jgi:hypothetical protein
LIDEAARTDQRNQCRPTHSGRQVRRLPRCECRGLGFFVIDGYRLIRKDLKIGEVKSVVIIASEASLRASTVNCKPLGTVLVFDRGSSLTSNLK